MSSHGTVTLTKNGSLRISADLLPEKYEGDLHYSVVGRDNTIELRPTGLMQGAPTGLIAKASFSNAGARSPMVAVRKALGNAGISLPKKSVVGKVQKKKDGVLVVKF